MEDPIPVTVEKILLQPKEDEINDEESTSVKSDNEETAPLSVPNRPTTPENVTNISSSSCSSPTTPRDIASLAGYSSSAPSTPREGSSSGSPSPIPDEVVGEEKGKPRIKLGKDLSMMMQALNGLQSPEEKIAALCKSYADLLDRQKLVQKQLRVSQRKQAQTLKEKDSLQAEHNKAVLAKGKLETLARELQKRNKLIKEEQNRKTLEEVALRKEMTDDFQVAINRVEVQMKTTVDVSNKMRSENDLISSKFNDLVDKLNQKEVVIQNLVKESALQEQLSSMQLKKITMEHKMQKEADRDEKVVLLERIKEMNELYEAMIKQEKDLKFQLQYYSEKFEDFKSGLKKSNDIFTSYQTELKNLGKQLKKAEKEKQTIQKKWEDSTKALADTVEYTQQLETKQARLEKLSRALQTERNELVQRLRKYEGKTYEVKNKKTADAPLSSRAKRKQEVESKKLAQSEQKTDTRADKEKEVAVNQVNDNTEEDVSKTEALDVKTKDSPVSDTNVKEEATLQVSNEETNCESETVVPCLDKQTEESVLSKQEDFTEDENKEETTKDDTDVSEAKSKISISPKIEESDSVNEIISSEQKIDTKIHSDVNINKEAVDATEDVSKTEIGQKVDETQG
ncbi:beta-taxilin [Ciona intestinalis]